MFMGQAFKQMNKTENVSYKCGSKLSSSVMSLCNVLPLSPDEDWPIFMYYIITVINKKWHV